MISGCSDFMKGTERTERRLTVLWPDKRGLYRHQAGLVCFQGHFDAAIALYKAGVAPKIPMSGNHGRGNYNEVKVMRNYATNESIFSEETLWIMPVFQLMRRCIAPKTYERYQRERRRNDRLNHQRCIDHSVSVVSLLTESGRSRFADCISDCSQ